MAEILKQLNVFSQCKEYKVSLWQCPQFLFLILGMLIIISTLLTYFVGTRYIDDPVLVALIVFFISIVLLILAFLIVRSFERVLELSRLKTEFIGVISHHLRTPISNLNWTLEYLMSEKSGEIGKSVLDYFKILKENSERMAELISRLLFLSRLETATTISKREKFSLEDLLKETVKKFEKVAKNSNLEIKFSFPENLPKAFADPSQVKLVIESFLDNAISYSREGGKIEIKIEKRGKNLYFEIKDNGVGIPKEDQKHIFQKFFRSRNILRLQTQGLGLSLFISKKIIESFGGKIGFKSKENKGSVFWFTLPIK